MAVIDADAHVLETERTWEYMLDAERAYRPRVVPTPEDESSGGESWFVDGTYIGKARNVGRETPRESREMDDIRARLKHMDELEVDVQVLYPTIFLRPFTRKPAVELGLTRSYNRWLVDVWKAAPERLRWVAVLPLLTMEKALEEARFAKENGACGLFMRGLEGDKRLSDPHFFPLYEEAARLDIIETALRYHLLSPYTSLVAVDRTPTRPADEPLNRHDVPGTLPAGRGTHAWPQTATGKLDKVTRGVVALTLLLLLIFGRWTERDEAGLGT